MPDGWDAGWGGALVAANLVIWALMIAGIVVAASTLSRRGALHRTPGARPGGAGTAPASPEDRLARNEPGDEELRRKGHRPGR